MAKSQEIYKIMFLCNDTVYEIFAKKVTQSNLFGFIEISEFVFGENSTLVVDTSEERLRNEFENISTSFIPLHSVLRIDKVIKRGATKMFTLSETMLAANKIKQFPNIYGATQSPKNEK